MNVLSFGSINIDYIYKVEHFVSGGETIASNSMEQHSGGKGLNQSVALARGGAVVYHAGKMGSDGAFLLDVLHKAGINTEFVARDEAEATGHAIIQVESKSGQNCIITYAGTNGSISKSYMKQVINHFRAGDIAVVQNEINDVEYAIHCCRERGLVVAFNPSPMTEQLKNTDIYQNVDYLFVNEIEGEILSGNNDPVKICRALHENYPRCRIVLTLGKKGALFFDGETFVSHGIYKVKAIDTTGAGDTFTGFFMAAIARGETAKEALHLASKASSISVERMGAADSIPALEEVKNRELLPE